MNLQVERNSGNEVVKKLIRQLGAYGISGASAESLAEYVVFGRPTGGFLTAVLSDSLMDAVSKADNVNINLLGEYAKFLYNDTPMGCWGSKKLVHEWVDGGGLASLAEQPGGVFFKGAMLKIVDRDEEAA